MDETKVQKIGHKIGAFFAYIVAGCAVSIIVAATIKLVGWILF